MKLSSLSFFVAAVLLATFSAHGQTISISVSPGTMPVDTICARTSVTFSASVSGTTAPYTLHWQRNMTAITGATNATYTTARLANGDVVSCNLYDSTSGMLLAESDTVHMVIKPLPVIAPITGANTVCVGDTVHLADSTAGGVWSSSNTLAATVDASGIVTAIAPSVTGPLRINYSMSNSCGSDTVRYRVRIALPAAPIATPANICIDSFTILVDSANGGVWTSSDTTIANFIPFGMGTPAGIIQGSAAGTVNITYNVTNACGTYTETTHLTVVNCDSAATQGITNQYINSARSVVFPNPANGSFSVLFNSAKHAYAACIITNVVGEKIKELTLTANTATDVTLNTPGVYFISITAGEEKYATKVVVTR